MEKAYFLNLTWTKSLRRKCIHGCGKTHKDTIGTNLNKHSSKGTSGKSKFFQMTQKDNVGDGGANLFMFSYK